MLKLGGSFSWLKCTEVLSVVVHLHELQFCLTLCRSCEHVPYGTGEIRVETMSLFIDLKVGHDSVRPFRVG